MNRHMNVLRNNRNKGILQYFSDDVRKGKTRCTEVWKFIDNKTFLLELFKQNKTSVHFKANNRE